MSKQGESSVPKHADINKIPKQEKGEGGLKMDLNIGKPQRQTPNMDSFPGVQCPPQQWIWNLSQAPTTNGTDKLGDVRSSCRHLLSGEKHPQDSELSWNMWSKIVKVSEI